MRVVLGFGALFVTVALASCGQPAMSKKAPIGQNTRVLKIAVFSDGRLTVDGAPATTQSLRESLRKLAQDHGVVWYYRQSGNEAPPPIATQVINEVIEARVPIRLSSKPDYSDSVTSP